MIDNMRVLAVIPARGGSKRLPRKNILPLAGRPLLAYSIEAALGCGYVDYCLVSTDDEEIAEIARAQGAQVPFLRSHKAASDTSGPMEYVMECLERLRARGEDFDVFCLLQPTSPLRTARDLAGALRAFVENGRRGLVSVSRVSDPPTLMRVIACDAQAGGSAEVRRLQFGTLTDGGAFSPLTPATSTVRSQDMVDVLRVNGAIYINMANELTSSTSLNDNPVGYVIAREHAVDVDDRTDFDLAGLLMERRERGLL